MLTQFLRHSRSAAQRAVERSRDLLARPGSDCAAECRLPALRSHRWLLDSEVREQHGLIDVARDLLGASLGGDVLRTVERRAAALFRKAQQIAGDQRNRPARAFLPWRVGGRAHDHLTNGSPTGMVRVTASDEEASERLGQTRRACLGPVPIEMTQCGAHRRSAFDRLDQLQRTPARLACFIVDPCTVLPNWFHEDRVGPASNRNSRPWWLPSQTHAAGSSPARQVPRGIASELNGIAMLP